MRHVTATLLAAGAVLAAPAGAAAHAGIESRSPKPGKVVDRPLAVVRVDFEARVLDANLAVRSAGGRSVAAGDGRLVRRGKRVRVRLRPGLSPGRYAATVRWLAGDGHAQQSTWHFRLR